MIHRHLDYSANLALEDLPAVAIADVLDRGDLDDWQAIAIAISGDPYGPVAEAVAHLIDSFPMYGTSPLWRAFIERRRGTPAGGVSIGEPARMADLRRSRGVTQTELAKRLGISQSDLSKLERRRDWRLSTLRRYVAALGGVLQIDADFQNSEATGAPRKNGRP